MKRTLSKATRSIVPDWLIELGAMQKMFFFCRRRCANTMPTVIAAGSAGGTTIVNTSSERRIISEIPSPRTAFTENCYYISIYGVDIWLNGYNSNSNSFWC